MRQIGLSILNFIRLNTKIDNREDIKTSFNFGGQLLILIVQEVKCNQDDNLGLKKKWNLPYFMRKVKTIVSYGW